MTNFEKFKDEILKKIDLPYAASVQFGVTEDGRIELCKNMECCECIFCGNDRCTEEVQKWLDEEYEEKFIDWESVPSDTPILVDGRNMMKRRMYFARGKNDSGYVDVYPNGCTKWSSGGIIVSIMKEKVEFANAEDRIRYTKKVVR